jgi:hypothetical protein
VSVFETTRPQNWLLRLTPQTWGAPTRRSQSARSGPSTWSSSWVADPIPIANRPICVALAVTCEGRRDILGLRAGDGGEAAKH